jgi:lipopolysaccharide transport system permease protein
VAFGVVYPSSLIPSRWRWLYGLNPMSGVIEGFRWALTGHGQPSVPLLLTSAVMVLAVLLGGLIFFQRMEGTVADLV